MSKPLQGATNIKTIDVVVELAGSVVQQNWTSIDEIGNRILEQALLNCLRNLAASLGLPLNFKLELAKDAAGDPPRRPIEVRIDGRRCPVPFDMTGITDRTELVLARFIAKAITEDRENLISEKLLTFLLSQDKKSEALDPMQLRGIVLPMIQRGLSIDRLGSILLKLSMTGADGAALFGNFEEALRAPDQIRLGIALGTAQVQAICSLGNRPESLLDAQKMLAPGLNALRRRLFDELGIILPKVKVECDEDIRPGEIRFRLNDLILPPQDGIEKHELLVEDSVDRFRLLGIKGREFIHRSTPKTIVSSGHRSRCEGIGCTVLDSSEFVVANLESEIRDRAELFVTTYCIDNFRTTSPQLVEAVCQKIGTPALLRILEGLLMEGLSIRDLRGICESILTIDSVTTADQNKLIVFFPPITNICPVRQEKPLEALDDNDYLACVRMWMKQWFSANYASEDTLIVFLLDQQLEQRIAKANVEPLTEDERNRLLTAVEEEITSIPKMRRAPILTTADVRRQLWTLLEREFRRYPVLNYVELAADLNITPIARISMI